MREIEGLLSQLSQSSWLIWRFEGECERLAEMISERSNYERSERHEGRSVDRAGASVLMGAGSGCRKAWRFLAKYDSTAKYFLRRAWGSLAKRSGYSRLFRDRPCIIFLMHGRSGRSEGGEEGVERQSKLRLIKVNQGRKAAAGVRGSGR